MGSVINFPDKEVSKKVERYGSTVTIDVYSDGKGGWLLEIVDEHWNSTCWNEPFETAQDALEAGIKAIDEEGIQSFIEKPVRPE
jgi:hypothetical protein